MAAYRSLPPPHERLLLPTAVIRMHLRALRADVAISLDLAMSSTTHARRPQNWPGSIRCTHGFVSDAGPDRPLTLFNRSSSCQRRHAFGEHARQRHRCSSSARYARQRRASLRERQVASTRDPASSLRQQYGNRGSTENKKVSRCKPADFGASWLPDLGSNQGPTD